MKGKYVLIKKYELGKLIMEMSLGGPVDHLQQLYMVRPDYLRHGSWSGEPLAAGDHLQRDRLRFERSIRVE